MTGSTRRRASARALAAAAATVALSLLGAGAAQADTTVSVCPTTPPGYARCQLDVAVNAATGSTAQPSRHHQLTGTVGRHPRVAALGL